MPPPKTSSSPEGHGRRRVISDGEPGRTYELLGALFFLGVLLFTPPLLVVFNKPTLSLGVPTLFLYLFTVWTALVLLVGVAIERRQAARDSPGAGPEDAAEGSRLSRGEPDA